MVWELEPWRVLDAGLEGVDGVGGNQYGCGAVGVCRVV